MLKHSEIHLCAKLPFHVTVCHQGGRIAQLVSCLRFNLGTQVWIPGLGSGHPMHEWEMKRLPVVKFIFNQLAWLTGA